MAYPLDKKRGATLLVHLDFSILTCGTIPCGLVIWAHIKGPQGDFHCTSTYRADTSTNGCKLWKTLHDTRPHGDLGAWGDFNFIELPPDSITILVDSRLGAGRMACPQVLRWPHGYLLYPPRGRGAQIYLAMPDEQSSHIVKARQVLPKKLGLVDLFSGKPLPSSGPNPFRPWPN